MCRCGKKTDDAYLLGALTLAARFSNACWEGVAVEVVEFCEEESSLKSMVAVAMMFARWREEKKERGEPAYHPVKALAELGKHSVPKSRINVKLTEFERWAPAEHVPGSPCAAPSHLPLHVPKPSVGTRQSGG